MKKIKEPKILTRKFYNRPTLTVAQELIGTRLHFKEHEGVITETEAYVSVDDPACHAFRGMTKRTEVMFGPAGFSYVYFIYGMYHCLNIVTERKGFAAAVLIRGVLLPDGTHLDGPGKLCRHFGITREHNGIDMTQCPWFYVEKAKPLPYHTTPRIGIRVGQDKLWRFASKQHFS